jgi:hypothetical protein
MKTKIFTMAAIWLVLSFLMSGSGWTQGNDDEQRLEATSQAIDKETPGKGQSARADALAKQFRLSPTEIQDLRAKKQGWGEVTTQLAMAQHLSQSDPKTYPTLQSALAKIESLRAEHMGYGKIAKELGFKLGPVVSDAKHVRNELVRDLRGERAQKAEKMERAERSDRPARQERPERPVRPEKPERPGR